MPAEEAPVKVSDSREAMAADKKGENSSISMSLQEAKTDRSSKAGGLQDQGK